jgi:hypothetical protein
MHKDQLFVERRPEGDYALMRGSAQRAVGRFDTQKEAIAVGKHKEPDHPVLVERVRNTVGGKRDKWRSV